MAPLPQNNTARLFFDYVTGDVATSQEHTCAMRVIPGERTQDEAQQDFLDLLTAWGAGNLHDGWRVTRVRYQGAGTNFSTPVTLLGALGAFVGTATGGYTASFEAVEMTWQGRSPTSGRRVDLSIYPAITGVTSNFRFLPGTGTIGLAVTGTVNALNANSAQGSFVAIDGTKPVFYPYINLNYNSYWERRLRTV